MSTLHLRIVMSFITCFIISSNCVSQDYLNSLINLQDRDSKLNGLDKATLLSLQNSQQRNLVLLNGLEFKLDSIHTIEAVNGMHELNLHKRVYL